ncbi:MAG: HlyD family efflux transporter periplasmic adaptor subunit [Bacillota bacterium]
MKNNVYRIDEIKKNNNSPKKKGKYFFYIFILIIIFVIIFFTRDQIDIIEIRYGELYDDFKTEGLIIREEITIDSPVAGEFRILHKEGDRVGYGKEIARINNKTLYNHKPGIISFATDKLEEKITPDNVNNISIKKYNQIKRNFHQNIEDDYINKNDFVYRIVNNHNMFLLIESSLDNSKRFHKEEEVFIQPGNNSKRLIEAKIKDIFPEGDKALIFISLNRFVKDWLNLRRVDISLVKDIYRGIILPEKAIFEREGTSGVLLLSISGKYNFKEVEIDNKIKGKVVVSGLEPGDKVVANPEVIDYGKGG